MGHYAGDNAPFVTLDRGFASQKGHNAQYLSITGREANPSTTLPFFHMLRWRFWLASWYETS
jgi:hypothetical protein